MDESTSILISGQGDSLPFWHRPWQVSCKMSKMKSRYHLHISQHRSEVSLDNSLHLP